MQWAHIITRGCHALRWKPYGSLCLCDEHHAYYGGHRKAGGHHEAFKALVDEIYGEGHYALLKRTANESTGSDVEADVEALRAML